MSPWLTKNRFPIQFKPFNQSAEVAELADALRSGRSELTLVRVQIPPPAQRPPVGLFLSKIFCFQKALINGIINALIS